MTDPLRLSELSIGLRFGPYHYRATAETIRAYARAVGDLHPRFTTVNDLELVAPPTFAAVYSSMRSVVAPRTIPPGLIHASQRYRFHRPVRAGDELQTTLVVAERYERKGREYVVLQSETIDHLGEAVTSGTSRVIWTPSA